MQQNTEISFIVASNEKLCLKKYNLDYKKSIQHVLKSFRQKTYR